MSSRFISPFYDVGSGIKPPSGAQLFFFETDGVTPKDTYSDQLSTPTPNANPVIADSVGVFGDIYIDGDYKVTLQDKNGSQIFGGAIVSDPTSALINDLSQAYEFATVAEYKAFSSLFPVGKTISLLDRGASFAVIAGVGTANTFNIIASDQVSQSVTLTHNGSAYVDAFGAVGDEVANDTLAIDAALKVLDVVKLRASNKYLVDAGVLTTHINGQQITSENSLNSRFSYSGVGTGLIGLAVLHFNVTIKYVKWSGFDGVGLQIGTSLIKANTVYLEDIQFNKCKTGFRCEQGNSGKWIGGFMGGDSAVTNDIGALWNGEASNSNGWFVFGVRAFDCGVGFKIEGDSVTSRFVDDSYFFVSAENYSDVGFWIDGGIRNQISLYSEAGNLFPSASGYRDTTGVRSNIAYLNGTAKIDAAGGFNGFAAGTAPKNYITWATKFLTADVELSAGTKTGSFIKSYEIQTLLNTSGSSQTIQMEKLDSMSEGVPNYFYIPTTNTGNVVVKLDDPAGFTFTSTATTGYTIAPRTVDQLFEVRRAGPLSFSIREVTGAETKPDTIMLSATVSTTYNVTKNSGFNDIIEFDNTSGSQKTITLTADILARVGFEMTLYVPLGNSDVLFNLSTETFLGAIGYVVPSGGAASVRRISTGVWAWTDLK